MKWKPALILLLFLFSIIPIKFVMAQESPIGWELLDDGKVLRIWNDLDSYYFNTSSGIQFSNHYDEYWSKNILGIGYYQGEEWHVIYWTDTLSGFNKELETDGETYVNITLWKDLNYQNYDFRLAIRYHLKSNDSMLTIQPYIKNLGQSIPLDIGFAWRVKDIRISNNVENDKFYTSWIIDENTSGGESYYLNQTIDKSYENDTGYLVKDTKKSQTLELYWTDKISGRFVLKVKDRLNQHNAPITLYVNIGTLNIDQEKTTNFLWHDADLIDSYSEANQNTWVNIRVLHPSSNATRYSAVGQSFTMLSSTYKITSTKFFLAKFGSPTGNAHAVLYEHSGTYGSSSLPTGPPLATSDNFDISTLTGSFVLYEIAFSDIQQYEMQADTYYVIVLEGPETGTVDEDNYVAIGADSTSPTHSGNLVAYINSGWIYTATWDTCFYVYGEAVVESYERNPTQAISWSSSLDRTWSLNRGLTQTLTFTWNAIGIHTTLEQFVRTITLAVNWASSIKRRVDFHRAFSQSLTFIWNALGSKFGEWVRTLSLSINLASSLKRRVDFHKSLSQSISFTMTLPGLIAQTLRVLVTNINNIAIQSALVTVSYPAGGEIEFVHYSDAYGYTPEEILTSGNYTIMVVREDYQLYNHLFTFSSTTTLDVQLRAIDEAVGWNILSLIGLLFTGLIIMTLAKKR